MRPRGLYNVRQMKAHTGALAVLQSGGPTQVINQSLAGVVHEAEHAQRFSAVLGAANGFEGLLQDSFSDLTYLAPRRWASVARAPGAALGSSRRKFTPEQVEQVLETLRRRGVRALVTIGGNDSAENALALGAAARQRRQELQVVAVPKTVDNDLPETDHCPGYGSAARFMALATLGVGRDTEAMQRDRPVALIEVMGRDAGWLAASSALGKREERDAPHLTCLPEQALDEEHFLSQIEGALSRYGFAVAVVSETLRDGAGPLGQAAGPEFVDPFGHAYYPSPAQYLARLVGQRLKVFPRVDKPGSIQRTFLGATSRVDSAEAFLAGAAAVRALLKGQSEQMVTLVRARSGTYHCGTGLTPLTRVAGKVRLLPSVYFDATQGLPTAAFSAYALPLLGAALPRLGRLPRL